MPYRRLFKIGLILFAGASIALSCAKPPKLETEEALNITKNSASFYCYVASRYKCEFGILVSRKPNPVFKNAHLRSSITELQYTAKSPCGIYQFDYSDLTPGSKYYFRVYCIQHPFGSRKEKVYYGNVDSLTTLDYEYLAEPVDMGLPSGTKWSSVDLGASAPNEKGALFFWGDSENKHIEHNPLFFHTTDGTNTKWTHEKPDGWPVHRALPLTKYCTDSKYGYNGFVDDKYTLEPEDDPAHVYLGGTWRTPTDVEWEELLKDYNCEWTFGKGGCIVRSRHNGNLLFFPRSYNRYMSSRISASNPNWFYSYDIFFEPDEENPADDHTASRERYDALIRPVCD